MYNRWLLRLFILFLILIHVGSFIALINYFSWLHLLTTLLAWQIFSLIGISVCYHRQISHRSFSTGRSIKLFHLFVAMLSGQAGPIVWSHIHRLHHRHSDTRFDPHSPIDGFWAGHLGWMFKQEQRREIPGFDNIPKDLTNDPDIVFFQKIHYPALILIFAFLYFIGGMPLMLWQGCFRITLTLHSAWIINSFSHLWGYRNFETADNSTNSKILSLFTAGEGLHNNHHFKQTAVNLAFKPGEFDLGYLYIKTLMILGLAQSRKQNNEIFKR